MIEKEILKIVLPWSGLQLLLSPSEEAYSNEIKNGDCRGSSSVQVRTNYF